MKRAWKKAGSLLLALYMVMCLLPAAALANSAADPTTDGTCIYANGTPAVIKEVYGTTNMYLATDTAFASPIFTNISNMFIYGGWANGDHTGDTSLTIISGTFNNTVYGGSREGTVTGNTNLTIQGGTFKWVYGGGWNGDITGTANLTIENGTFNETVFGGNDSGTVADTDVTIKGGTFKWVYGGGWNGNVAGTATLTIENGTFTETVFGGSGYGTVGSTNITIKDADADYFKSLFGGGNYGSVTTSNVTIEGGQFFVVFGGGAQGDVENTNINISGGNIADCVFGGGAGDIKYTSVVNSTITISGGTLDRVFGGAQYGEVTGSTTITMTGGFCERFISGGGVYEDSTSNNVSIDIGGDAIVGNVYGGDVGSVAGQIEITAGDEAIIQGDLIGGRAQQSLSINLPAVLEDGDVAITLKDNAAVGKNIYGAGSLVSTRTVTIHLRSGRINNTGEASAAVFAGGKTAHHLWNPGATYFPNNVGGDVIGAAVVHVYPEVTIFGGNSNIFLGGDGPTATVGSDSEIIYYHYFDYNANGGTGTAPAQTYKAENETFLAAQNMFGAPASKQFKEWNTATGGTGTGYQPEEIVTMPEENLVLYAIWEDAPINHTVPTAPQNLSATPGNGQVTLSWTPPENDGGAEITGYEVSSDGGSTWTGADSDTDHLFTSLTNGQSYTFKVRAVNSEGGGEEASMTATPQAQVTLQMAVADGVADTTTSTKIDLTFSPAIAGLTGENITITDGTGEVTKGALTGSGTSWSIALDSVTTQGNVSVAVSAPAGYTISGSPMTVAVYKALVSTDKTFVSITAPGAVTGVANGTEKTAAALGLPTKVTLVTDDGNVQADVTWDVASSSYNPGDTAEQTFAVGGTVTLPAGVINPSSIALNVSISVTVNAAPSGGGGGSTPTTPPAEPPKEEAPKTETTGNTATATTTTTATVDDNGKATAAVTREQISDAISQALAEAGRQGGGTAAVVEIKVEAPADVTSVETIIPKEAIDLAADGNTDALTASTPIAAITFDANALSAISDQTSEDVKITVSKVEVSTLSAEAQQAVGDRPVFNFSVTSGDKTISEFGGSVSVAIPYTPKDGEDTDAIVIYYINAEGNLEIVSNCIYDPETGTVSFKTNHFSLYAIGYNKVSFNDVAANAWYSKAVGFIAARGIAAGTGGGNYRPDAKLTRGEFLVMMMRAYGIAPDVNPTDNFADAGSTWYTGHLAAAKRLGISRGVGNNIFAPGKEITRQEMFTLLYNALKVINELPKGDTGKPLSSFSDAEQIASWAKEAMKLMTETGTISGSGGKLSPASTTTRAEMGQVLYSLLSK